MGCLLCGKPIGLVRKLKDPEFCSNEHRRDWVEVRGGVLVDRLVEARSRIERARDRYIARKAAPPPAAEPGVAPFLVQMPVELSGNPIPVAFGPELGPATGVRSPELGLSPARPRILAGFQPDLPWPAWNAGLRCFGDLGLGGLACSPALDYLRAAARIFGDWKPEVLSGGFPLAPVAYTSRPDVLGRRAAPYPPESGYAVPRLWQDTAERALAAT